KTPPIQLLTELSTTPSEKTAILQPIGKINKGKQPELAPEKHPSMQTLNSSASIIHFIIFLTNNPFVVDLETATGGSMSKKKAPRGALHGPAGGSFSQKKKVVIGNVKHSGDEKDISLNKSGSGGNVLSDVDSLSSNNDDASMSGFYGGSPLSSAANTPKAKHVDTGAVFGSPLKSPNFTINDVEVVLPSRVPISLDRK
ncbi:hypothetical protein G9A89_009235, partial [Geosiphon pyriformis]